MTINTESNLLSSIYNGQKDKRLKISIIYSKNIMEILKILYKEGYIRGYKLLLSNVSTEKKIEIYLKYTNNVPAIKSIQKISLSSRKIYISLLDLKNLKTIYGNYILSTSKGFLTNKDALKHHIGGELLYKIL